MAEAVEVRYERKFRVDQLGAEQVQHLVRLHPALFVPTYPPRYVNNLYLDSDDLRNYRDNVSGVPDRCKARVRWYGALFGPLAEPTLELKIKRGLVGHKERYPLAPFTVDVGFDNRAFGRYLQRQALPGRVAAMLRGQAAVLLNRYRRWYYATTDGRFRLTIDRELSFYRVAPLRSRFGHCQVDHRHVVVELKYAPQQAAGAHRVASYFPFRMTRSSKYVQGIERVFP